MAKFLFITGQHPNEAFSTSVAKETAKLLRAKGQIGLNSQGLCSLIN